MKDPFEKFGITHLSPSSLNLYAANPALWCGKYLLRWQDEMGPAAHRGSAIEAGLDIWLFERKREEALSRAHQVFAEKTEGQADDEFETERANIAPMLLQAIEALKDAPVPLGRQIRIEHYIDGIEVPVLGFIDYMFDDYGIDLKTTKACPSAIKADHGRQVATYSAVRGKPFKILYVTAKKSALYPLSPEEAEIHLKDMARNARAIRHLLKRASDPQDAMNFFAFERSDFRWSEQTIKQLELAA